MIIKLVTRVALNTKKDAYSMHMADALLSPGMGDVMCAATTVTTVYSARKVQSQFANRKTLLMGVLGAIIFAAQIINFSIPDTGSSGHLGGDILIHRLNPRIKVTSTMLFIIYVVSFGKFEIGIIGEGLQLTVKGGT